MVRINKYKTKNNNPNNIRHRNQSYFFEKCATTMRKPCSYGFFLILNLKNQMECTDVLQSIIQKLCNYTFENFLEFVNISAILEIG